MAETIAIEKLTTLHLNQNREADDGLVDSVLHYCDGAPCLPNSKSDTSSGFKVIYAVLSDITHCNCLGKVTGLPECKHVTHPSCGEQHSELPYVAVSTFIFQQNGQPH